MHDVIVVGAGPGGSTAATVLALSGFDVLLLERESFPRDKVCGDVVAASCFDLMAELGLSGCCDYEECYPIDRFVIKGPKGTGTRIDLAPNQGVGTQVVRRVHFDEMLRAHAVRSGATYRQLNVQGLLFDNDQVVGVEASSNEAKVEVRCQVVIAADGPTSAVARALQRPRPRDRDRAVAVRGYVRTDADIDPAIELTFSEAYHPGYAWFIPVEKRLANVGIGMRVNHYKAKRVSLPDALDLFLQRPDIRARVGSHEVQGLNSWQLPMFSMRQRRLYDGAILVGDAGGFVNPLTGDGIYEAMMTARYAAEACMEAIRKVDLTARGLSLFEELLGKHLLGAMRRASILSHILGAFPAAVDALLLTARVSPVLARRVIADYGMVQSVRSDKRW